MTMQGQNELSTHHTNKDDKHDAVASCEYYNGMTVIKDEAQV